MRSANPLPVLVVGQTPPPITGQSVMLRELVHGPYRSIRVHHVRMAFSRETADIGKFQCRKLAHLAGVVTRTWWARARHGCRTLCYPPAGHAPNAIYRDIVFLLLVRPFFKRTVLYFHAGGVSERVHAFPAPLRWLACRAYSKADCTIRTSSLNPDDGAFFGCTNNVVIPNAIKDVYPSFSGKRRKESVRTRLLFMGILYESKGVLVLLEACANLVKRGCDVEVLLAGAFGSPEFEKTAQARVAQRGLADRVSFAGVLSGDDKWQAFLDADIFCFPSYFESETFGLVVLEAMQFGLPVVATRWRGIPSLVRDTETGLLVNIQDSGALADAIARLLEDPQRAAEMGRRGREVFCEHYTLAQYHSAVERVLAGRSIDPVQRAALGPLRCSSHTREQFLEEIRRLLASRDMQPRALACVNAHIYNLATRDEELRRRLNAARVLAADGIAIVWAARWFGHRFPERCNMTEAFHDFLRASDFPETSAVLIGCTDEELHAAGKAISSISTHCRIAGTCSGFLKIEDYRAFLEKHDDVDLVLIGAGTPRSEELLELATRCLPRAIAWHVGGGTVRILAGTIKEAPRWMRWCGLQWLHRLCLEPVRLAPRYLAGNPRFILHVVRNTRPRKRS